MTGLCLCAQVPGSQAVFLDATLQEEAACPDKLHVFVNKSGRLCGVRMEGTASLPADRIRPLLEASPAPYLRLVTLTIRRKPAG